MKLKGKITGIDLDFLTHKPKLTLQLTSQIDIATEEFNNLQNEELLDIEIAKHREKRSLNANSYFHALINQLARHFTISDEDMKVKMVLQYGTIARDINNNVMGAKVPKGTDLKGFYPYCRRYKEEDNCDCYLFYKRTSELNSLEFSQLLNGVVQECRDCGIQTLDEIELQRLIDNYVSSSKNKEDK